jgi:hypothetical protein
MRCCIASVAKVSQSASWMPLYWSLPAGSAPEATCCSSHSHWKYADSYSEVGVS